jgi:A/G-specific adenine glycosylase
MSSFEKAITDWFAVHKRDLPWRNSTPWGVMVSEFMLQQTPVVRVLPKWNEWVKRWPTPQDLASATPADVITAWGRLGYPRRALRLYECAKIITNDFAGKVPDTAGALRSLPGIGDYTAAAIAAFAYNESTLVLDVNIRRLFARVLDGVERPRTHLSNDERLLRRELIPERDAPRWAAATMELGALVCSSRTPKCGECPLVALCMWRAAGYPKSDRPRKTQGWHGTNRQCRGVIVQALRENACLNKSEIQILWHNESQIENALFTLLADGLISITSDALYSLPQNPQALDAYPSHA